MRRWFVLGLMLPGLAWGGQIADRIAAVVNEQVITLSDVYDLGRDFVAERCSPMADPCAHEAELEILDSLIKRMLIRQELSRLEMAPTGADVDQAIDRVIKQYEMADRAALRAEIERGGMRWETYREQLLEQLRTQRFQQAVIGPLVTITDDEVRDRYQRMVREMKAVPLIGLDALGIVIPPDADEATQAEMNRQALALVDELNAGTTSWEDAVPRFDGAKLSTSVGGERRYKRGQLMPALDDVVFDAEVGVFLPPVVTDSLLMVVRINSREMIKTDARSFEDAESGLRDKIFQDKVKDAEEEWYQRARRGAAVRVLLKAS